MFVYPTIHAECGVRQVYVVSCYTPYVAEHCVWIHGDYLGGGKLNVPCYWCLGRPMHVSSAVGPSCVSSEDMFYFGGICSRVSGYTCG